jgi:hypothetical protein
MVKPSESDLTIQFSPGSNCTTWLPIPLDLIEEEDGIEFLRTVSCKDHQHPYVRLKIKELQTSNKETALLAGLLRHAAQSAVPSLSSSTVQPSRQFAAIPCSQQRPGASNQPRSQYSSRATQSIMPEEYWYCYVDVHCGNGEFQQCEGTDLYQDAIALDRAYEEARYFCRNRDGVLSYGPTECGRQ